MSSTFPPLGFPVVRQHHLSPYSSEEGSNAHYRAKLFEITRHFVRTIITTLAEKYIFDSGYYQRRGGKDFRASPDPHGPVMCPRYLFTGDVGDSATQIPVCEFFHL